MIDFKARDSGEPVQIPDPITPPQFNQNPYGWLADHHLWEVLEDHLSWVAMIAFWWVCRSPLVD